MVIFVLWGFGSVRAQTTAPPVDTSAPKLKQIRPGLELPDSLYIARDTIKSDIDTIVRYMAEDSTVFGIPQKKMTLVGKATVEFENRELDAHTIVMDFQQNLLTAYSRNVDSVLNSEITFHRVMTRDTTRAKNRGAPKLTEDATVYEGEVIVYNFKTKQGTTQLGTTEMEGGFYYGEKIKQVAPKTLFVKNGRYTTCDEPSPHYYFASPEMKVNMGGQIFAAPVYLYVADVPIFALPFGVFPDHESGRHSGIIPPSYQTQGGRG
ncbi:MAG TPA: putative LPS assembly protein LptD, partial [Candidatus Kapabacteria bacterium]|nr:putative LPS assembly protein LptD [Candidatus Kapabacteria bacterium]